MSESSPRALPSSAAKERAMAQERAMEELLDHVYALRSAQLPLARLLIRWVREGKPFDDLSGSVVEFGHEHGIGAPEIHRLLSLGALLEIRPDVEARLLAGALSFDNASVLHDLLSVEGAARDGEDWLARAEADDHATFRNRVDKRLAEVAAGGRVQHMGFFVPAETGRRFERARTLASRKAGRPLTRGETLGVVVTDYLLRHDPLWKDPSRRPRRNPRRPSLAADHVAAAVKLEVRRRFGDRCAVDGCTNEAHLEFAHILARALGGSNTAGNLLLLCSRHHRMFDARRIFLRGNHSERRRFVDRDGRFVAWLRDAPVEHPAATGPPD